MFAGGRGSGVTHGESSVQTPWPLSPKHGSTPHDGCHPSSKRTSGHRSARPKEGPWEKRQGTRLSRDRRRPLILFVEFDSPLGPLFFHLSLTLTKAGASGYILFLGPGRCFHLPRWLCGSVAPWRWCWMGCLNTRHFSHLSLVSGVLAHPTSPCRKTGFVLGPVASNSTRGSLWLLLPRCHKKVPTENGAGTR